MRFRTYALTLIFTTALCVCAVAGLNMAVDPYHYFGTAKLSGFNANKPYAIDQHRIAKVKLLSQIEPRTLIIGNSRFDVGLDPASSAWPDTAQPVFNLAIPGQGVRQTIETLEYALAHHQSENVFWGVDFLDFLVDPNAVERALDPTLPETPLEHLKEMASVSLSIEGLLDSLATLTEQGPQKPPGILPNGFNATGTYADIIRGEGHAALFRQKNLTYLQRLTFTKQALSPSGQSTSLAMAAFERTLHNLARRNIRVTLVTYPYHADLLEIIHFAGLWPALNEWQTWLESLVTNTIDQNPEAQIALWDYIGYSSITTEHVPDRSDRSASMAWFWESGHFKPELGDRMLEDIYNEDRPPQTFNKPAEQQGIEITRQQYRLSNSAAIARIESLTRRLQP